MKYKIYRQFKHSWNTTFCLQERVSSHIRILEVFWALNPSLDPWSSSASKLCSVFNLTPFIAHCCHTVELATKWLQRSASKLTWATDCILKTQQRAQSSILVWRSKVKVGGWGTPSFFASVIYNVSLYGNWLFYVFVCQESSGHLVSTWYFC